ncbi:Protein of unknown function [Lactobacillus helveticus CIRM-BIA 104]|uniref:Uncharacterized protein n=1 Tax=Lactobacillus helveticus CIRM-BIA 104 TaxID=1226333 RepID=U6FBX4_LACHE|nr:Protein of unknown function [Lactobacillus helveticus CIRM-BIA 104]
MSLTYTLLGFMNYTGTEMPGFWEH